ncbi:HNH endonuclease [Hyalangium rubrum]|uniref:HNH endonuclease signature motif containing protein n=1 Tax=Hyalangium rubrum TaxID=3103134 RepID=A0ABU5HFF6_9BACT|nr:HNH endonuclease signature motif containing protein [Hyalangium sp. s54d21]MDY7231537.1 HNH endonuclease signature motif containing protein [Hyalangium sp. s54d21]
MKGKCEMDASKQLLEELTQACAELGVDLSEALQEKLQEVKLRGFWRCVPNARVKPEHLEGFLESVLGVTPPESLVERLEETKRGPRLSHDEYLRIEEAQNYRCALCGIELRAGVKPQVDHIVPVAFFGRSEVDNYQLLCQKCNLGKSSLLHWVMGMPFFDDPGDITYRMRFCVLSRFRGRCEVLGCDESSVSSEMNVAPRIPVANGGRLIFDNLRVLCDMHMRKNREEQMRRAEMQVRRLRLGVAA